VEDLKAVAGITSRGRPVQPPETGGEVDLALSMPARSSSPVERERSDWREGRRASRGRQGRRASRRPWRRTEGDFSGTRPGRWARGERGRGDGSWGLPSQRGRAEIFSGARALSFRGGLVRAQQRSSIRPSLLGRALSLFSYPLSRVEVGRAELTNRGCPQNLGWEENF
jgi:hypothetical protein